MRGRIYFLLLLGVQLASTKSRNVNFYRRDYTYLQEFNAFYKLHRNGNATDWNYAFLTCEEEGSKLFYPKEENEQNVLHKLMDMLEESSNRTEMFLGIHDKFHLGEFMTIDGNSVPSFIEDKVKPPDGGDNCLIMDSTKYKLKSCTGSSPLLFICKRQIEKLCPTIDQDYKYFSKSNKCYKLNKRPEKWDNAMKTCFTEGGILAVVNSLMKVNDFNTILNINPSTDYYVGLRDLFLNGNYYTVKGTKFDGKIQDESPVVEEYHGYELPSLPDDMPIEKFRYIHNSIYDMVTTKNISENGTKNSLKKLCGVLSPKEGGEIKAEHCEEEHPFICEMEV